ncbi:MAG: Lrp/AsnC family transcriptional regulator [Candidatus Thorarchaeota archaeon]
MDYRLLCELMKNAKRSDRELARLLGVSQPTVTRKRAMLEKNFLEGYTAIPKWGEVGFEVVAFNLMKTRTRESGVKERDESIEKARRWLMKQPNVVLSVLGEGLGWDAICVSFHKSYSDFADFKRRSQIELADIVSDCQSFIADIDPGIILKPFHLKYLSELK